MGILEKIGDAECWREFLEYKTSGRHMSASDISDLKSFVDNGEYLPVVEAIRKNAKFPYPELVELNKKHSAKKRKVFVFDRGENYVLKLVAYLLNAYDGIFPSNLYSFRRNIGVKQAIWKLIHNPRISEMYSYKVDIHDYFNSVDTDIIVKLLRETLQDDVELADFIESILREPISIFNGEPVECKKGIMAGVPISGFLANLYLKELDEWFEGRNILYARYSDDIIVFSGSADDIALYEKTIKDFFIARGLTVNGRKEFRTAPREPWEFLGFSVEGGEIDVAQASLDKIKAKLKRKARALRRWKDKKGLESKFAIRAFIKFFNRKFYDNPVYNEITWCRWYFPTINTPKRLHIIDEYAVSCIRYIATGKHTKANYNLKYDEIKSYGYKSLVNSFYKFKNDKQ